MLNEYGSAGRLSLVNAAAKFLGDFRPLILVDGKPHAGGIAECVARTVWYLERVQSRPSSLALSIRAQLSRDLRQE
jgi:hypothetical protein